MMKRTTISVLALAISALVGSAVAVAQNYNNGPSAPNNRPIDSNHFTDSAQVLRVDRVHGPYYGNQDGGYVRQECWNERTNGYEDGYYRDTNGRLYQGDSHSNTKGAVIGALVGGALGNQVGKGDGRTAATVAGVVVGATVGANTGHNDEYNYRDDRGSVRRCRTVVVNDNRDGNGWRHNGDSYNVTYRYANQVFHTVTNYDPGRAMRVIVDVRPYDTTH